MTSSVCIALLIAANEQLRDELAKARTRIAELQAERDRLDTLIVHAYRP